MATDPPPTHVAFLRGINVAGHRRLAMADLREVCASLGWSRVRTHGASGKVVVRVVELAAEAD